MEGKEIFHTHFPVDPQKGDSVDHLPAAPVVEALCKDLYAGAHNKERSRDGALGHLLPRKLMQRPLGLLYKRAPLRLVEKTPSNCFRVPMLAQAFPDARFIFLVRRGEEVVSSLMEGWKRWSGVKAGEAWSPGSWHYLMPPGWREWRGRPLQDICAFQWAEANRAARRDLAMWAPKRTLLVRFEELLRDPEGGYERIRRFCELRPSAHFASLTRTTGTRVFTTGGSKPRREKWRDLHEAEVLSVRPQLAGVLDDLYPPLSEDDAGQDEGGSGNRGPDDEQGIAGEPVSLGHDDLVT